MNNPLMFNDPSGEELVTLFTISMAAIVKAIIIGAAVGLAAYTVSLAVTGNFDQWNLLGAFKATFTGAVSGAVTFGIGNLFSAAGQTGGLTLASSLKESIGGIGSAMVQAGTHAIAQGVLGMVQGDKFLSAAAGGFFGSLGAGAFGEVAGKFAKRTLGTILFGAISGGIGSELTGGNFWQGALIGGVVAGLNHTLHEIDSSSNEEFTQKSQKQTEPWDLNGDGRMDLEEANNWYRVGKGKLLLWMLVS